MRTLLFLAVAVPAAAFAKPKVALYMDHGCRGGGAALWAEMLSSSPEMEFAMLNAADVKAGKLADYDCLVMPGGGGFERYDDWGEKGCAKIRDFIRNGGGYIGTCAGESVLLNEKKRIRMIPYKRDGVWERGGICAQLDLSPRFEELTGVRAGKRVVRYHNGPIAVPTGPVKDSRTEVIATFDCDDTPAHDAISPMRGKPAALWTEYGKGRMFIFAVHPEAWEQNHDLVRGAFKAVLGIEPAFKPKEISKGVKVDRVMFKASGMDKRDDLREHLAAAIEKAKGGDKLFVPYTGTLLEGPFTPLHTPWTEDASVARSIKKGRELKARVMAIVSGTNTAHGVEQAQAVQRLAKKHDAKLVILARPADDCTNQVMILDYYTALAKATKQTIIIQSCDGRPPRPSVETLVTLAQRYFNYGYVKEDLSGPQGDDRVEQLLRRREIKGVFSDRTGADARLMHMELIR